MAFTGITATEAEIDQKTGAGVSTAFTDTMKTQSLLMAENYINSHSRFNWSDAWGTLNVDVKHMITRATASLVAIDAINYDMSGYTSRQEALTMINVLLDIIDKTLRELNDQKVRDFVNNA